MSSERGLSAMMEPECRGYPCLRNHDNEIHRVNILGFIAGRWYVDDIAVWAGDDAFTFPLVEETLRQVIHYSRDRINELRSPSSYFVRAIQTVASRTYKLSEEEIAGRVEEVQRINRKEVDP